VGEDDRVARRRRTVHNPANCRVSARVEDWLDSDVRSLCYHRR
jgi:hypothetical protein